MSLSFQNQRALCSILRNASCFATVSRSRTPRSWIRAITTKHTEDAPSISFGPDADIVLSKYIKKPLSRQESTGKAGVKSTQSPHEKATVEDNFEIHEYVDLSSPSQATSAQDIEVDEQMEFDQPPRRRKNAKIDRGDGKREKPFKGTIQSPAKISSTSRPRQDREEWQIQKQVLKEKFKEGWNPRKKLSPDAMEGIRGLHEQDPIKYSTAVLAQQFKVSPEAIRRILKSKWLAKSGPEKLDERREKFAKRHDKIWDQQAELGLRPKRTKDATVEDPDQFEHDMNRRRILREI